MSTLHRIPIRDIDDGAHDATDRTKAIRPPLSPSPSGTEASGQKPNNHRSVFARRASRVATLRLLSRHTQHGAAPTLLFRSDRLPLLEHREGRSKRPPVLLDVIDDPKL